MRLTHVRLLVSDYPGCFRFYRDVLGLQCGYGDEEGGYADFSGGGGESCLAIFDRAYQGDQVELRPPGDGAVLVFRVDDVDAAAGRFREHVAGEPVSRPDWGIRVVYLRDPDGNLIELNEEIPMEEP
jgi:catechol 2,3-dioxygenase-like lactoylglutathione lyase family enzyme